MLRHRDSWMFAAATHTHTHTHTHTQSHTQTPSLFSLCISCRQGYMTDRDREKRKIRKIQITRLSELRSLVNCWAAGHVCKLYVAMCMYFFHLATQGLIKLLKWYVCLDKKSSSLLQLRASPPSFSRCEKKSKRRNAISIMQVLSCSQEKCQYQILGKLRPTP